jgi:eukaryotic-like serine/threonine-protein kinase
MDHPNIARVLDAGATESGRPYFVMELVRGIPITDYCDREQLSIPERLDLFVLVCRAVQHAHQKGIIHRDLKPTNVLVTMIDGAAVPKVIDFGVAKATGGALTERTLFTGFAQMIGTPLYMSPEQAELSGVDVDTRSDIYALGVLLYELLTGSTPFDQETLRKAAFDEVRRIIREEEPPKPSTRLSSLGDTLTAVSAKRNADPRHLARALRGELDWIVMRALEKDRRRRYETANDFAADVMRYLTDRPVEACPPSVSYRFAKYARRNRVAIATAVLVGMALIGGTGVSLWQAAQARKAQRKAQAAEARATTEAATARRAETRAAKEARAAREAERHAATQGAIAQAVNDFLQDDLLGNAGHSSRVAQEFEGDSLLTVSEALDRAAARIGHRFQDQPLVEAAIQMTIGRGYRSVRKHQLAVAHFERAVALRRTHLGPAHPETLESMQSLCDAQEWTGRFDEMVALQYQILEYRQRLRGPDDIGTLACVGSLAHAYFRAGQWDVSARLQEDLLSKQSRICGPAHDDTLCTKHQLAMSYYAANRLDESMALHEELLKQLRDKYGPEHQGSCWPLLTYGQVCQRAGKLETADRVLRQALELARKDNDSLGTHINVANALGWLGLNELLRKRYSAAESLVREATAVFAKDSPDETRRFYWISVLGEVLVGQQRYAEAEPLLEQGYEGMHQRKPVVTPRYLNEAGRRLVHFYEITGQPAKALIWRERVSAD